MAKVRVQLDLTDREADALDGLRDGCGLRSRADAVKASLAILEWVKSETRQGRRVLALDSKGFSMLAMPGITD